ncbi:hypothetical protein B0A49_12769, partial [Cryomyces minteri]
PSQYPQYDWLGDWSGSAQPVSLLGQYDGNLTIMFTCVDTFPIGWTENETIGSEEQCLATSSNRGLTWQKYAGNPILTHPPDGWNLTGWRDPYFHAMSELDVVLGYEEAHFYLNDRRVLWGKSDEDINGYGIVPQGFQGSLGLPRELFIMKTYNVVAPPPGRLRGPGIWTPTANDSYTVITLGTRPSPDVVRTLHVNDGTSFGSLSPSRIHMLDGVKGDHFHLRASLILRPSTNAGFIVRASPGMGEFTRIIYDASNSALTLDRGNSILAANFTTTNYQAFVEPYTTYLPNTAGPPGYTATTARTAWHSEAAQCHDESSSARPPPKRATNPTASSSRLHFDVFADGSLVEIFVNDRFAPTSRICPTRADALSIALSSSPNPASNIPSTESPARFQDVSVWTDRLNAWPQRPLNSSSPLHYEPYYETHVTAANEFGMAVGAELCDGF